MVDKKSYIVTVKIGVQGMAEEGIGTAEVEIHNEMTIKEVTDALLIPYAKAGEIAGIDIGMKIISYFASQMDEDQDS